MSCRCSWSGRGSPLDLATYAALQLLIQIDGLFRQHQAPRHIIDRGPLQVVAIDPKSLEQLKSEMEKIPPQKLPRAEANRRKLKRAIERIEKESTGK